MSENVDNFWVSFPSVGEYEHALSFSGFSADTVVRSAMLIAFRGNRESLGNFEFPSFVGDMTFYCVEPVDEFVDEASEISSHIVQLCEDWYEMELASMLIEFFCRGLAGELENVSISAVESFLQIVRMSNCVAV